MPVTYPPAPPVVDAQGIETISRFLNTPTLVQRRLRTLAENRFIADTILQARPPASGGAVQYEQNESIFPDRVAEAVEPGADYPTTTLGVGPSLIAAVRKWGIQTLVTDEAIRRLLRNPVDRAMTKLVNGVVKQVDTIALAAIAATVTQTFAAPTAWTSSTRILRDILSAKAAVDALNQGYIIDTAVVDDLTGAVLASDPTITNMLRRESGDTPVYTGSLGAIGGVEILTTPNKPTTEPLLLDRTVLGGLADEVPLQSTSIREEDGPTVVEGWVLRAKRITVPFVMEPNAAIKITGT